MIKPIHCAKLAKIPKYTLYEDLITFEQQFHCIQCGNISTYYPDSNTWTNTCYHMNMVALA